MRAKKTASKTTPPKATRPHMPGYGLPKSKTGLLAWKWAVNKLSESRQYWIVTVRPDGRPHTMPVWGLWLDNVFYFSTGAGTRKARNLSRNPHCVVANEDAAEAVIVEGKAKPVHDLEFVREFLSLYERKYKWDMSSMADEMISLKQPVFAVRPGIAFGQVEKTFSKTATRWKFSTRK
jgi:nitroimidazol reductase NimA-like FMN-containing flavoprotein (pyridoxamine 5'-phosphate oxidase superfamily)